MYCFIIMPFGKEDNEKKYWKNIYEYIESIVKEYDSNIRCERSDLIHDTGDKVKLIAQ